MDNSAAHLSLPLRKCGLKHDRLICFYVSKRSLPLRKCGLKQMMPQDELFGVEVTSLAEVWIETFL